MARSHCAFTQFQVVKTVCVKTLTSITYFSNMLLYQGTWLSFLVQSVVPVLSRNLMPELGVGRILDPQDTVLHSYNC